MVCAENDPKNVLKWADRLTVLTGVAKAVHFLHTGLIPGFFNNRLKANNILLNEDGMAKLSDYGLSIIGEDIKQEDVCKVVYKLWFTIAFVFSCNPQDLNFFDNLHLQAKGEGVESW